MRAGPPPVPPEVEPARSAAPPRLHWVDVAKAAAIVLVVVYHVSLTGTAYLLPGSTDWGAEAWRALSRALMPVRMPLFFLVSGLLARSAVARPWVLVRRRKLANLLWPFVLWSLAFGPAFALGYGATVGPRRQVAAEQWAAAAWGSGAYWYLAVLAIFVVIARALRDRGVLLVAVAAVAWLETPVVDRMLDGVLPADLATTLTRLMSFGVWFFLGCFARPVVERVAATTGRAGLLAASACFVGLTVWIYGVGGAPRHAGHLASVVGVLAAAGLSVRLARHPGVRRWSRLVAECTLPIYVVHPMLLTLAVAATRRPEGGAGVPGGDPVLGLLFTPVVTALLVAAAVGLHRLAGAIRARWVFQAPAWITDGGRVPDAGRAPDAAGG